ncbi:MAG: hypothetical protein ACRENB_15315 [Gemmatimonadales bacterium]
MSGRLQSAFASTLPLACLLGCGGAYRAPMPEPAPPAVPAPQVVTGTCRAYDVDARTLDLVTGVSVALRTIPFRIHENTEVTIGGRRASLANLRANVVVRIEYRVTSQGNLADRITVLLDARGMRSP